ncbi:MAG: hypothetical protein JXR51_12160 [Bacteroidales bacterium]|nr:hypothetical protein [Bacteroidales bacterium]MBN2757924.1 hypothetical protein [Bacteroidales bacterium]
MNKKTFFIIFSVILISTNIKAQIEDVIKSYVDSTEFLVNNGRKLILQTIIEGDYKKAQEIYQFLDEKTQSSDIKAFDYYESIYITMLIHDWRNWSELTKNYNDYRKSKIYQNSYKIFDQLYDEILNNNELILFSIESSSLDDEGKSVAKILLHFLNAKTRDEEYNKMLGDFNKVYKTSDYNVFLVNSLPRKTAKMSWGFSFGASSLYLTDNLAKNFTPSPMYSFSMDVNIGKIFFSLYFSGAVFKLNNSFTAVSGSTVWDFQNGEYFDYFEGGVLLGYFVIRNKRINISPYIKLADANLTSTRFDNSDEGEELDLFDSFTYGPGLHAEVKLFDFKMRNFNRYQSKNYISLKLESGYNFISNFNYDELKGNSAYIGVSLLWGTGQF